MKNKNFSVVLHLVATFSFVFAVSSISFAQEISNGSFETGPVNYTFRKGFIGLPTGSTSINNWNVQMGTIDYIGRYWEASDGDYSLDLNGSSAGTIAQTFETTIGKTYHVDFDLAGNPVCTSPIIKTLLVTTGITTQTFNFDITGLSTEDMGWVTETFSFKASSNATTLLFMSQNTNAKCGPALDNIRLKELKYADAVKTNVNCRK